MTLTVISFSIFKKNSTHCLFTLLFLCSAKLSAQKNDTIFFNSNWKRTIKDSAFTYRTKPLKIKTKKAIGHKIKNIDSLYIIKEYYVKNNALQFEGFSKDAEGKYSIGKAKWYSEDGTGTLLTSWNYKETTFKSVSRAIDDSRYIVANKILTSGPPIIYLNYSIANEELLTLGIEFCLYCQTNNKLFLGLGLGLTDEYNGKSYYLPNLHLNYSYYSVLFVKAGTTSKNSYIMGGLTLRNFIDLGFGYSLSYNNNIPSFKGFTTSINLRLTRNENVYSRLRGY